MIFDNKNQLLKRIKSYIRKYKLIKKLQKNF